MRERFQHLFRYDEWANREFLNAFARISPSLPRPLKLMAHILGTQYVWYSRIRAEKSLLAVWPELSIEACQEHVRRLSRTWNAYLDQADEARLATQISYRNTKGESWTSSTEDILMHVIMHSAYHRGQIASDMRAAGHTPAYTDYIHGVRQNLLATGHTPSL